MDTTHFHFAGQLTARDCKRHIPHAFVAPADSRELQIHFRFTPARGHGVANLLTLTLFDPHGFRGAGHRGGACHQVRLTAEEATPGYLRGQLPAGAWNVQIDTHMIMPAEAVCYWLDVSIVRGGVSSSETPIVFEPPAHKTPRRGPGWYRGDLHTHTNHSDGGKRTVAELIQSARQAGLDFVFLTDHNTNAGQVEMPAGSLRPDDLSSNDLLMASGIELTTFWGHALCLGAREWIDWRVRPGTGDIAAIAAAARGRDQVFIIAHPQSKGDPGCTGCAWRFGEMMPGDARLVEIWNGPWAGNSNNEGSLALWYDWLNQGLRLVATAGSDTHGSRDYGRWPGFSVIYAEELSEAALLKALAAGRLYLSAGPQLAFQGQMADGACAISGDTVSTPADFTVTWANCPEDAQLRLIANGRLLRVSPTGDQGVYAWRMTPADADWVLAEVRNRDGEMLAITNPIFLS
ncbi:MAG: phosphotransferase [Chloroflexi bacterium]|nr:phosphotransferase [Chloroflexota bacterium]